MRCKIWPRYLTFEEVMLFQKKWTEKYTEQRVVMRTDTNISFAYKASTALKNKSLSHLIIPRTMQRREYFYSFLDEWEWRIFGQEKTGIPYTKKILHFSQKKQICKKR